MSEQTKQKIVATAKNWVDDAFNINGVRSKLHTNEKLRASGYFIWELQNYIGKLMFDSGEDYTTADESEIINAVLD